MDVSPHPGLVTRQNGPSRAASKAQRMRATLVCMSRILAPGAAMSRTLDTSNYPRSSARAVDGWRQSKQQPWLSDAVERPVAGAKPQAALLVLMRSLGYRGRRDDARPRCYRKCYE